MCVCPPMRLRVRMCMCVGETEKEREGGGRGGREGGLEEGRRNSGRKMRERAYLSRPPMADVMGKGSQMQPTLAPQDSD